MPIQIEGQDSQLGRWTLARWSPPDLAGLVEGVWCFEGTLTRLRERHFPLGLLELVVHLGPVYGHVEADRVEPFPAACLSGLLLRPDVIEAPSGTSAVLGMRLHPAGAFALLRRPLHELTGVTVDLNDVMAGAGARLADSCAAASTPEARVRSAVRWLREHLAPAALDPAVLWAAGEIEQRSGAVSIQALIERAGWSRTRFTAAFREQIGITPKLLARIRRFRKALEIVNRGEAALPKIALACGYYDQPHFNREFRELSGYSPGAFGALRRFPGSVSVAE
jgi:AraC-like DNA-binding protein